jgi:hypothetical protein
VIKRRSLERMVDTLLLLPRQRREALLELQRLQQASDWRGDLPVLLLNRCWLRLEVVSIAELCRRLPPDVSREAPELVRYRELLSQGMAAWVAQQLCWREFGPQACHQAQRRFWSACEQGMRAWTLEDFLALLEGYRWRFANCNPRPLPLLVLARDGEALQGGRHLLHWLEPDDIGEDRPMRHTCA